MEDKKLKKLSYIIIALMMVVSLSACSKKGTMKDIEVETLAESLRNDIVYEDELSSIDLETAEAIYDITDIKIADSAIYVGSGATAEEIAVFQCETEEDAKKLETVLKSRVEEQTESFRDYVPKELEKLEKAVIVVKGKYVILSVSNEDAKAKEIIQNAFQ